MSIITAKRTFTRINPEDGEIQTYILPFISDNCKITDTRNLKAFKDQAFGGYNITQAGNALDKSILEDKIEPALHWCLQLFFSGIVGKLWSKLITIATKNILKSIKKNKIKHFIFSSTAAVYKTSNRKLTELSKLEPNNIYGKTKLSCEKQIINILKNKSTNYIIFRFFNVCSSLFSLKVGEIHNPETHLIPILAKKFKENKKIYIYGNNFKTTDKTCIRDYIHVADIVRAFQLGIEYLEKNNKSQIINLGSEKGLSTLEIFKKFLNFEQLKIKK